MKSRFSFALQCRFKAVNDGRASLYNADELAVRHREKTPFTSLCQSPTHGTFDESVEDLLCFAADIGGVSRRLRL
jgi:hypothetical protein